MRSKDFSIMALTMIDLIKVPTANWLPALAAGLYN